MSVRPFGKGDRKLADSTVTRHRFHRLARIALILTLAGGFIVPAAIPAHAWVCNDDCVPDPQPPPRPDPGCSGSNCIPGIHPTVVLSGVVSNVRGTPLAETDVYWAYGIVKTNAAGAYAITVWADNPVTLYASHSLYEWQQKYLPNPLLAAASPQNFEKMRFMLGTEVTPAAFNNSPQKTLTLSTYSTAPQSGTRVVARLPTGSFIDLAYDTTYTDPAGWKRWTGAWTVPAGTADGAYTYSSCAIDSATSLGCDPVTSLVLSQVKSGTYKVDGIGPTFGSQVPAPNHNTLARRPAISTVVTDALSGVDWATRTLTLDGAAVSSSVDSASGVLSYTPISDLALGIHTVVASAQDLAGNLSSTTWQFNVIQFSAAPGTASIDPITVTFGPGAEQVTFASVPVAVGRSRFSLSSSMSAGGGTASVAVPLASATVTFRQAALETQVNPNAGSRAFTQEFAVLAPSDQALDTIISGRSIEGGPITVSVPAAYRVTGGEAVLSMSGAAASIAVNTDPIPEAVPCAPSANCSIRGLVAQCLLSSGGIDACDGTWPDVYLRIPGKTERVVGGTAETFNQARESTTYSKLPHAGCGPGKTCADLLNGAVHQTYWSIGDPFGTAGYLFRAFGHHYYRLVTGAPQGPLLAAWQESDVQPGATACVPGSSRQITTRLKEFTNAVEEVSASGWSLSGTRAATRGSSTTVTEPDQNVVLPPTEAPDASQPQVYKLWQTASLAQVLDATNVPLGDFADGTGQTYEPGGVPLASVSGTYNNWKPLEGSVAQTRPVELMTGTEYSGGNELVYSLRAMIFFEATYDNGSC